MVPSFRYVCKHLWYTNDKGKVIYIQDVYDTLGNRKCIQKIYQKFELTFSV